MGPGFPPARGEAVDALDGEIALRVAPAGAAGVLGGVGPIFPQDLAGAEVAGFDGG
jgi:hypothetical protein